MIKLEVLKASVKEQLFPKRYDHTLRVMETSMILAKSYGACLESVQIAALLHDVAKNQTDDELQNQLKQSGLIDYLNYNPLIWHAPVGALMAKKKYHIDNQDILNAIQYHTTGRSQMSKLEQIIFLADYIEPNRTQPNVEKIRQLATRSLEAAIARTLADTVAYLTSKGNGEIHPDTLAAYEAYKQYL